MSFRLNLTSAESLLCADARREKLRARSGGWGGAQRGSKEAYRALWSPFGDHALRVWLELRESVALPKIVCRANSQSWGRLPTRAIRARRMPAAVQGELCQRRRERLRRGTLLSCAPLLPLALNLQRAPSRMAQRTRPPLPPSGVAPTAGADTPVSHPPASQISTKDRIIEGGLMLGVVVGVGTLAAMLRMIFVHIFCGLFFMSVAAYTMIRGQEAPARGQSLAWFVCTGAVLFLFSYWALQVVFRPPKMKETLGCGGVRFVDGDGNEVAEDGKGGFLRTEL